VVAVTARERIFRKKLLEQAEIGENDKVLDLACGTGTMAGMVSSTVLTLIVIPAVYALVKKNQEFK